MRAAVCETYGTPRDLVVRELPDLTAAPGTVLVDVEAAAVNFPDVLFIADKYQLSIPVPFVPGSEYAGRVAAVGAGVSGFAVGDDVMGSTATGAFATQVCTDPALLSPIPAGLTKQEAAAFRVTYLTAYHALVTVGGVQPGDWVVVLGAAGGVGTAAVDVAVRLGARVVAAASSADRLEVCRRLGAEATVSYGEEDLKARIKEITGRGADVVIDPVGGPHSEQALRSTTWGGRFVCLGFASGEIPRIPLNLVLLKGVIVRGMELRTIGQYVPESVALADRALADLVAGGMKPVVSAVYALDDVAEAMEQVSGRKATGKVVITMT